MISTLVTRYGMSLDSFLRANLHFARVVMPEFPLARAPAEPDASATSPVPPESTANGFAREARVPSNPVGFLADFCAAVLPTFSACPEYHRVSALFDDTVLGLRAQRLSVEAFNRERGTDLKRLTGAHRRIQDIVDPTTMVREHQQFMATSTLDLLQAGKLSAYHRLYPVGRNAVVLNSAASREETQSGLAVTRTDMSLWLPVLHHYGFVPLEVPLGPKLSTVDEDAILSGFAELLYAIVEAICFFFNVNPGLPGEDYRQDLLIIHHRARRIAAAWDKALLQSEVALHRVNGYADLMAEKLLILASGAKPTEAIYGSEDAVPAVAAARVRGGAPTRVVFAQGDILDFEAAGL